MDTDKTSAAADSATNSVTTALENIEAERVRAEALVTDSAAAVSENIDASPDVAALLHDVVEVSHEIVNQSAMNMRATVKSLSLMEQRASDWLRFYQESIAAAAQTLSDMSKGGPDESVRIFSEYALDHFTRSSQEAASRWEAACEITNNMLSNVPERMSMMNHSSNRATAVSPLSPEETPAVAKEIVKPLVTEPSRSSSLRDAPVKARADAGLRART